jgi:hypothetical protein
MSQRQAQTTKCPFKAGLVSVNFDANVFRGKAAKAQEKRGWGRLEKRKGRKCVFCLNASQMHKGN